MTFYAKVLEFHQAFRLPCHPGKPTLNGVRRELRRRLLTEEFKEYEEGEDNNDLKEIADALGDMLYIIMGTAIEYGIPIHEVFAEIHASNMSKLDAQGQPIMREDGKVLKSTRYFPPRIEAILRACGWTGPEPR